MDTISENMKNVSLKHNNDKIEVDCESSIALTIFRILLVDIINKGSSHEHYDDAEVCLDELAEIEHNDKDKLTKETDNFLCELQLDDNYNNYCRLLRYFYGHGIYNDTDYKIAVAKIIDSIKEHDDMYSTYNEPLDYALNFFDDDTDEVDGGSLMALQVMRTDISLNPNISNEIVYLSYDVLDYIDLSIDFD